MPGAWGSPDEPESGNSSNVRKGGSLFSNITRRLGLDSGPDEQHDDGRKQLEQLIESLAPAGPSAEAQQAGTGKRPQKDDGRVTSPVVVQQNLLNAINATRAHGSESVFSQPTVSQVKEQATY